MAKKAKSLNPADAFRKAQRQKEVKRNKLDRKKAREDAQSKKDSKAIEAEIRQLERLSKLTASEQSRLQELKHELSGILKAKGDPAGLVRFGEASSSKVIIDPATGLASSAAGPNHGSAQATPRLASGSSRVDSRTMDWFGPDGKLLEPEKSFYYDPVFNPFGVPPPGMPMRMKPSVELLAGPSASATEQPADAAEASGKSTAGPTDESVDPGGSPDKPTDGEEESGKEESGPEESDDGDSDEIPLPEGSPPRAGSEEDSDDEIPLPDGPPPAQPVRLSPQLVNRSATPSDALLHPSRPISFQPPPFFPPPITLAPGGPLPAMIAGMGMLPFPIGPNGFPLPPPPLNHPLSSAPPSANLPSKPSNSGGPALAAPAKPAVQTSATVTGLPQLRDLKREATSFVPAAIRKKRKELDRRAGLAGLGSSNRIQAAPEAFSDQGPDTNRPDAHVHAQTGEQGLQKQVTTSLLGALKRDGVVLETPLSKNNTSTGGADKDDYEKFVESLGDIL